MPKKILKTTKVAKKEKDMTIYPAAEAIKKAVAGSKVKFDASVELHFNLNTDVTKADQTIRTTTVLPHGTGRTVKVAVFASKTVPEADLELTEDDLARIQSGALRPNVDFNYLVAEPRYMPKLATVAKILGPAGVMPNPKTGTVSENPAEAVKKLKKGQVELKNEQNQAVLHTIIGKVSFSPEQLQENFDEVVSTLKQNKPQKAKPNWIGACFVTTSMGPSYMIDVSGFSL